MDFLGPFCFGLVIGWVTYRTLRRNASQVAIGDIAAVIAAVGGATVVGLFKEAAFDTYCVGLAVGFFLYLIVGLIIDKISGTPSSGGTGSWMGS